MGCVFSKNKEKPVEQRKNKVKPKPTIKELIQYYEYIKGTKHIEDVDVILEIINNTDWDNTPINNNPISNKIGPSAPSVKA